MSTKSGKNRFILFLIGFLLVMVAPVGIGATAVDPTPVDLTPPTSDGNQVEDLDFAAEAGKPPLEGGSPSENLVFGSEQPVTLAPTSPPTIDVWYGPEQNFGQVGRPQRWVNILGNISSLQTLTSVTYRLNGGTAQPLKLGSDRRLDEPGDFNIEIAYSDLQANNTIMIMATDAAGESSSETVTVNRAALQAWPLPYSIQWNSGQPLQNLVQVVDGLWQIQGNTVRTAEPGYDRMLAVGDIGATWKDYEVTAEVTVHNIDEPGFNTQGNGAGIGFISRWRGHYQIEDEIPRQGWRQLGALAWYRWTTSNTEGIELRGNGGAGIDTNSDKKVEFGKTYLFKLSSLSTNPGSPSYYRFKIWEKGKPEPVFWDAEGFGKAGELESGSVLLLAHNVNASFGPVSVTPLAGQSYTITRAPSSNGTIKLSPEQASYTYAQRVGIQAVGNVGYKFAGWGGDLSGTQNPVVVNVTQNMNISATFEPAPPPVVNVRSSGNGSVSVDPDKEEYQYGETITLTAMANPGYLFAGWTGDLTGSQNPATYVINSDTNITANFASANPDSIQSDDFNCGLNTDMWTFIDPLDDSSYALGGGQLRITAAAGASHNPWSDTNRAPRMMQTVNDPQFFEAEVKFESAVTQQYQMQGMMAEQNDKNYIRFEYQHNGGSAPRVYVAAIQNGTVNQLPAINLPGPLGATSYLRMTRANTVWTFAYSANGTDWTPAGGLDFDAPINQVGVFSANHNPGAQPAPAHTAVVDYFFNSSAPIVPEDDPDGCSAASFPVYLPMTVDLP